MKHSQSRDHGEMRATSSNGHALQDFLSNSHHHSGTFSISLHMAASGAHISTPRCNVDGMDQQIPYCSSVIRSLAALQVSYLCYRRLRARGCERKDLKLSRILGGFVVACRSFYRYRYRCRLRDLGKWSRRSRKAKVKLRRKFGMRRQLVNLL